MSRLSRVPLATRAPRVPTTRLRPVAALVAVLAATSLAACSSDAASAPAAGGGAGGTAAAGKALRIGFLPPTIGVPAFQGLKAGLEGAGQQLGDTILSDDAKGDPTKQLQTLQQWVRLGQVDALWVIPTAAKTIAPALKEAQAKGIVILAGGKPADYGFDGMQAGMTFSDVDNTAFGKGIGDLAAKCVTERLGGKASAIYVGPPSASESTTNINTSTKAALAAGAPGATLVQELVAKADLASTQIQVASALQGHPDSNMYVTGDAESTLAGLNAYTAAGKDPAKTCIVGNGGDDAQKKAVTAGTLYGIVAFDFVGDLMQNLQQLHTMAGAPTAQGKQLVVPITTIVK